MDSDDQQLPRERREEEFDERVYEDELDDEGDGADGREYTDDEDQDEDEDSGTKPSNNP